MVVGFLMVAVVASPPVAGQTNPLRKVRQEVTQAEQAAQGQTLPLESRAEAS